MVVSAIGEIDMATAPKLQAALDRSLESPPAMLIVDLLQVDFLASAGLSLLVTTSRGAAERNVTMRVIAEGRHTLRPLRLTKLDSVLEVYPDLRSALAADPPPTRSELNTRPTAVTSKLPNQQHHVSLFRYDVT